MIEWMVRLRQAAIIMIITTPFLADSVCDSKPFSSLGLPKASVLYRPNNRSLSLNIQLVSLKSNILFLKEKQTTHWFTLKKTNNVRKTHLTMST